MCFLDDFQLACEGAQAGSAESFPRTSDAGPGLSNSID